MKKTILLLSLLIPMLAIAQSVTEKKAIRFYEHHSSSINGNKQFGAAANGSKSGYDFAKHDYYGSYKPVLGEEWTPAELQNIDMVEHNGKFGNNGLFGITSGISSIWGGDIEGNNTTLYMEAPATFNYTSATKVTDIKNAFDNTKASKSINVIENGKVYIARIRNGNQYIAMKVTNVLNLPPNFTMGIADVYFDFDYKYGTYDPTIVPDITNLESLSIVPNPARNSFKVALPKKLNAANTVFTVFNIAGQTVLSQMYQDTQIDHQLPAGNYIVRLSDGTIMYQSRLSIVE